MSRALELCFQLKQYDVLYQIAEDLTESTTPAMIARVSGGLDVIILMINCSRAK